MTTEYGCVEKYLKKFDLGVDLCIHIMILYFVDTKGGNMTTTKKLGRPTSNPKSHSKRLRMTDEEVQKLEYCTKQTGKTQTDVLMLGLDKVYQELKK